MPQPQFLPRPRSVTGEGGKEKLQVVEEEEEGGIDDGLLTGHDESCPGGDNCYLAGRAMSGRGDVPEGREEGGTGGVWRGEGWEVPGTRRRCHSNEEEGRSWPSHVPDDRCSTLRQLFFFLS